MICILSVTLHSDNYSFICFNSIKATIQNFTSKGNNFFLNSTDIKFYFNECSFEESYIYFYNCAAVMENYRHAHSSGRGSMSSFSGNITFAGTVSFFNNSGTRGGAMNLFLSTLNIASGANVSFVNNTALDIAGALYIEPGFAQNPVDIILYAFTTHKEPCFYQLLDCSTNSSYNLYFANNSAANGGDDIYGASFQVPCQNSKSGTCELTVTGYSQGYSSVSSDPKRVCFCDSNGHPQCDKLLINRRLYPGEQFNVSVVLVEGDFGVTIGTVHTNFMIVTLDPTLQAQLQPKSDAEYSQIISSSAHCSELSYSLYGNHAQPDTMMYLTAQNLDTGTALTYYGMEISPLGNEFECEFCNYTSPVFISITLALPCPPGFTLMGDPPGCDCFPVMANNDVKCNIINGTGYFSWNSDLWVSTLDDNHIIHSKYCPFNYCQMGDKHVNMILNDVNAQCAFNRAGRLCGGCKENYSLAIGSSHCVHCPNNNNLALFIFFAAAGLLLVFVIGILNLTVTQGVINGLVFYANVIWTYQSVFLCRLKNIHL